MTRADKGKLLILFVPYLLSPYSARWCARINNDEKVASKKLPSSRLECKNHTQFMTQMAK